MRIHPGPTVYKPLQMTLSVPQEKQSTVMSEAEKTIQDQVWLYVAIMM